MRHKNQKQLSFAKVFSVLTGAMLLAGSLTVSALAQQQNAPSSSAQQGTISPSHQTEDPQVPERGTPPSAPAGNTASAETVTQEPQNQEPQNQEGPSEQAVSDEAQKIDTSDATLEQDANGYAKSVAPQNSAASQEAATRTAAADPELVVRALEQLREAGVTEEATPDFDQKFLQKLTELQKEGQQGSEKTDSQDQQANEQEPQRALGNAEKLLCALFPGKCARSYALAQWANRTARPYGQMYNGKGDAFKHAYWSALMTYFQGEAWATALGNAHEARPKNPRIEKAMDLHNNAIGRGHGRRAILVTSVKKGVDGSFRKGELWLIRCSGSLPVLAPTNTVGDYTGCKTN